MTGERTLPITKWLSSQNSVHDVGATESGAASLLLSKYCIFEHNMQSSSKKLNSEIRVFLIFLRNRARQAWKCSIAEDQVRFNERYS